MINQNNNNNDNDIFVSKIFVGITLFIAVILFSIAFFNYSNIHFRESIIIDKSQDSIINILYNPANFSKWNPWQYYDTTIIYQVEFLPNQKISKLYWHSPTHPLTKGHLFIDKTEKYKLIIDADLAEQTHGTIEFSTYQDENGRTLLQFDYTAEYPLDPMKRLYGFAMQFYFPNDMKQALKLLKSNIE